MDDATLIDGPRAIFTRASTGERIEIRKDASAGRLKDSDIVLSQGHVSRNHARLTFSEGFLWIEDLGSANGTFVNEERISGCLKLSSGDRIRFDREEFQVSLPAYLPPIGDVHLEKTRFVPPDAVGSGEDIHEAVTRVAPTTPPTVAPRPLAPQIARPVAAPIALPVVAQVAPPVAPPISLPAALPAAPIAASVVAPPVSQIPTDVGSQRRPGAWARSQALFRGGPSNTKYIPPSDIKQMMDDGRVPPISAPEMNEPHLQILSGKRSSVSVPLRPGKDRTGVAEWSIGSHPERDVVLEDVGVSAFHARIINEGRRWKVADHMSANGTFVNGQRSNLTYLSFGDRLRFGPVECIFHIPTTNLGPGSVRKVKWLGWAVAAFAGLALLYLVYRLIATK